MFSSNITPKNFIAVFLSVLLFATFKADNFKGKPSLVDFLWKKGYLVFLLFSNNLFGLKQSSIFLVLH